MEARSMFATLDGARWFHVPNDAALTVGGDGGVEIRGLMGQRRSAPAEILAGWEVERERGLQLAREELARTIGSAGTALAAVKALAERQGRDVAALGSLQAGIAAVTQALRGPDAPAPTTSPVPDLQQVFEAWAQKALQDPEQAEKIRRATADLAAAADRLSRR